jgi:UrcA family protein
MKTLALIAAAAASFVTLAVPFAAPAAAQDLQVEVAYANLDIASEAGAATLAGQIESGIKTACGRQEARNVMAVAQCQDAMIATAVEQLNEQGAVLVAGNLAQG